MKRDAKAESLRLHRARRAAERVALDAALAAADVDLDGCREQILKALVTLSVRHPRYAAASMGKAIIHMDRARETLRKYFDAIGSRDHG